MWVSVYRVIILFIIYMLYYLFSCVRAFCLHICLCTSGMLCVWKPEEDSGPLGLELQMVVSHTHWVLGIDSRSLEELVGLLTLSHLFRLLETAYLICVVDLLTRNSWQDWVKCASSLCKARQRSWTQNPGDDETALVSCYPQFPFLSQ